MARLNRHRWKLSAPLMYAAVVGSAVLVASLMSIRLETSSSSPVPRVATVDRSTAQILTPHVSTSVAPPPQPPFIGLGRTDRGAHPVASDPAPTPTAAVPPATTAIRPQTVSPELPVFELPSPDTKSQPDTTDSSSPDATTAGSDG